MTELEKAFETSWHQDHYHGNYKECAFIGFKAGAQWQSKQSPWISVEDKFPDTDNGQSLYNVIIKFDDGSHYIVANIDVEDMMKAGGATHWMEIPELPKE